jgi:uncharacterized protein (DUF1501 family)
MTATPRRSPHPDPPPQGGREDSSALQTRRELLALLAAGAATLLPRVAFAAPATERRLVFIVLRGGMDGLGAVPPVGDPSYGRRGSLALDPAKCLGLDGHFALNPALQPIHGFWPKGELAVVPAAGNGYKTRSHFDAQDLMEAGLGAKQGLRDGWLNRALALLPGGDKRLGLAVGNSVPLVLRGAVPVASWEPPGLKPAAPEFLATLVRLYDADAALGPALREGLKAKDFSAEVLGGDMKRGPMGFGPNAFRPLAEAAGKLLAAADGPRVAVLEMGGWDTHAGQGTDKGRLAGNLAGLAEGLAAVAAALGPAWRQTIVVAETEFGRTVAANGTGGTDHGTASAMLLMGGALKGGRVVGDWPGLDRLEENRDLRVATDSRAVLKGVLRDHLGLDAAALDRAVFPDAAGARPLAGLVRA